MQALPLRLPIRAKGAVIAAAPTLGGLLLMAPAASAEVPVRSRNQQEAMPVPMRPLRSPRRFLATLPPLIALAVIVPAVSGASATPAPKRSASIVTTLHSPRYLQKHCPIEVAVNFGSGRRVDSKRGVSVGSSKTHVTVNGKPNQYAVRYHWRLSKHDQFCGIVGVWYGPDFRSLKPTTESAHGGIYIDTSVEDPSNSLAEFIVYARPVGTAAAGALFMRGERELPFTSSSIRPQVGF